jgi:hypothetical protein
MNPKKLSFALLATYFSVCGAALGQAGQASLPSVPGDSIYIWNGGNKSVTFYISSDEATWNEFTLGSDESQVINLGNGIARATAAIKTGDITKKRSVEAKSRYRIYFDSSSKLWDVGKLQPN